MMFKKNIQSSFKRKWIYNANTNQCCVIHHKYLFYENKVSNMIGNLFHKLVLADLHPDFIRNLSYNIPSIMFTGSGQPFQDSMHDIVCRVVSLIFLKSV